MARKLNLKKTKRTTAKEKTPSYFSLSQKTKRLIWGVFLMLVAVIIVFSFFDLAGMAGSVLKESSYFLIGKTVFFLPLLFISGALVFLKNPEIPRYHAGSVFLGMFILILGASGSLGAYSIYRNNGLAISAGNHALNEGGFLGYLISTPLFKIFGFWVTEIIFSAILIVGGIILFQFLRLAGPEKKEESVLREEAVPEKAGFIKKMFRPRFEIKEVPAPSVDGSHIKQTDFSEDVQTKKPLFEFKTKPIDRLKGEKTYIHPPLDLLEADKGTPTFGDIKINSAIIKKTLQNFDIPVEMSEVSIGPTVTQYTLKPADGIKLSRITGLSSDLALSLSARSIRIEAPIPGRPLVGIEVPNKTRTTVRLRNLLGSSSFQNLSSNLVFALGRDVAGNAVFADLSRMPHLLVAGSTGAGKTICLNTIILSLLYRNSPDFLKLILIDPKRVEFVVYNDIPHLLAPVILDAQKTVNVLKWLVGEMERRFEILAFNKARDIIGYNELMAEKLKSGEYLEPMPFIVLIVDELADLMAARGREVEAGIVRLAQMARAVGIHLIVATQRPSVEVITGLIKANITSRITFQVASQVDSRTVLDTAGAEKLLGFGDMLFLSAEIAKPKRIQGAYVSDKETKKVVSFLKKQKAARAEESEAPPLKVSLEEGAGFRQNDFSEKEEPIFNPTFSADQNLDSESQRSEQGGQNEKTGVSGAREAVVPFRMADKGLDLKSASASAGAPALNLPTLSLRDALDREEDLTEGLSFGDDPLYEEAKKQVFEAKKASASLLQRRLKVGYARAARLIDMLEERGMVGPGEGAKPREVYIEPQKEDKEGWQKV